MKLEPSLRDLISSINNDITPKGLNVATYKLNELKYLIQSFSNANLFHSRERLESITSLMAVVKKLPIVRLMLEKTLEVSYI